MLFLLIVVLNIIISVTSNPLQGFQSCPRGHYQQNQANTDLVTPININAYPHQIQNQPLYVSNAYEDQLKRIYLNPVTKSHLNQNIIYQPIRRKPTEVLPNTVNNYIIVPQEYLKDKSIVNEIAQYIPQINNGEKNNLWIPNYDFSANMKCKNNSNQDKRRINSYNKLRAEKHQEQENKYARYNECRKRNKSRISKTTGTENLKQDNQNLPKQKSRISNSQRGYPDEYSNGLNKATRRKEVKENTDKKCKTKERSKSTNKLSTNAKNLEIIKEDIKATNSPQLQISATDCFDIHEDCTDLENRCTRNNYNNDAVQNLQQQCTGMPKEFTNNIASYLNNFMPNQNVNTNLFGGNGNFPYNFDYLFQTPQSSNSQSNGSDKRRRNRRRKKKQKPKNKTEPETSSSKPNQKNGCTIILDVTPKSQNQSGDITTTEFIPTEELTTIIEEPEKQVVVLETADNIDDKIVKEPDNEIVNQPLTDKSQEYTSNDSQEYVIPYVYDNGIADDYYPDFTLDNIYTSKEDNNWNFHGRHFYESDNKPEMSRERRKFEPNIKQKLLEKNYVENVNINDQNDMPDNSRKIETSVEEIQFKTPPKLEFPDFKTEMVNKDKYNLRAEPYYQPYSDNEVYQNDKLSIYSDAKSGKSGKNIDNTVETVYAHSKVIKYGAAEHDDKVNNIPFDYIRNNVYTSDEETTVVVAKSLNYPKNYY